MWHEYAVPFYATVDLIMTRARNAVNTTILQVKSYTGIEANDAADALANEAAELMASGRQLTKMCRMSMHQVQVGRTDAYR